MLQDADEVEAMISAVADGSAVLDGATTPYVRDHVDEPTGGPLPGEFVGTLHTVVVASGKLPTLCRGAFPVIDGVRYRVRDLRREDDGQTTRLFLTRGESS